MFLGGPDIAPPLPVPSAGLSRAMEGVVSGPGDRAIHGRMTGRLSTAIDPFRP